MFFALKTPLALLVGREKASSTLLEVGDRALTHLPKKGKNDFGAPSMKDKRTNLLREGKREEKPQSQSTLAKRNLGIRKRVDTWIKSVRFCYQINLLNHIQARSP